MLLAFAGSKASSNIIMLSHMFPLALSAQQDRELFAAAQQVQQDALRHGWGHIDISGVRLSAHATHLGSKTLLDLYCEDGHGLFVRRSFVVVGAAW